MQQNWKRALFFGLVLWVTRGAYASDFRLIETNVNQKSWMSLKNIEKLAEFNHQQSHRCPGFMDITDYPEPMEKWTMDLPSLLYGEPTHGSTVDRLIREVEFMKMKNTVNDLSNFFDRYYQSSSGVEASNWIKNRFLQYAQPRNDIIVEQVTHSRFKQPSVIARIQGAGPHADEIVVIGGHLDSINWSHQGERAPGADDNASGISTVLEIFRVLAQSGYRPDRTIEFMGYAGEEAGLLGSQDISRGYRAQDKKMVGAMQFDMTMFPGNGKPITLITDFVDPDLTKFVAKLVDAYVHVPWVGSKCNYGCSDHASWTRAGYPSVFPFEAPFEEYNHNIHTSNDVLSILDPEFGSLFAKLGVAYAVELGGEI